MEVTPLILTQFLWRANLEWKNSVMKDVQVDAEQGAGREVNTSLMF